MAINNLKNKKKLKQKSGGDVAVSAKAGPAAGEGKVSAGKAGPAEGAGKAGPGCASSPARRKKPKGPSRVSGGVAV